MTWLGGFFPWSEHPADDRWIEFIDPLAHGPVVIRDAQGKGAQVALFFKVLAPQRHRERSGKIAFAICSLIPVFARIPSVHASPAEIVWLAVFVVREQNQ